jgi:hypothetical protein
MPDADAVVVAAGVVAVAVIVGALAAKEVAPEEWCAVMIRICISENKEYERMEGGDVLCFVDFVSLIVPKTFRNNYSQKSWKVAPYLLFRGDVFPPKGERRGNTNT